MKNSKSSASSAVHVTSAQPPVEEDCLLTAVEATRFLNLKNVGTVYQMVSAKRLPVIRLSARCIRFSRRALLEWVEGLTQPVAASEQSISLQSKSLRGTNDLARKKRSKGEAHNESNS